jgi:TonB family protein
MPARFYAIRGTWTVAALLFLLGASLLQAQKEPPAGPPYRVDGDVKRPEKISGAPPAYTDEARKARVTGVVILETLIDEQGNVTENRVLKGLPMGLSEAAVEAVRSWKFNPATLNGQAVPVYYSLVVNFQLDAGPSFAPALEAFMESDPDFTTLFQARRYQEAAELLDRRATERPGDPGIQLARSYLLLEQGRPAEAQEALADRALAAGAQSQEAPGSDPGAGAKGDVKPTRPEKISGDYPQMPEKTRRAGASGVVIVEATIDEQGNVQDARVVQGVHPDLDKATLKAVRTWKFKPATYNGKPVKVHYNTTFTFH